MTPKPTLRIAKALLFALEYAEVPSFIGLEEEEGGRRGGKKDLYRIAGKISETKVGVSVCWGAANNGSFLSDSNFKALLSDCSELYFVVDH